MPRFLRLVVLPIALPLLAGAASRLAYDPYHTAVYGGTGGTSYSIRCPAGSVLSGLHAFWGDWINGMQPKCRQVRADGTLGGDTNASNYAGGLSGGYAGDATCPAGSVVGGFHVWFGWYVHSIRLRCFPWVPKTRSFDRYGTESNPQIVARKGGPELRGAECTRTVQPVVAIRGKAGMWIDSFGTTCDEP